MKNNLSFHLMGFAYGRTFCACSFNVVAPPARTKPIRGDIEESVQEKRLTTTVGVKAALGLKLQVIPNLALVSAVSIGAANNHRM